MLPMPQLPQYDDVLPFSAKKIKYRPYTVKEEKILMMAAATGDAKELTKAAQQVLNLCASIDASELSSVDIEYLFLKLRAASVGETVDIVLNTECELEECDKAPKLGINLSNVEIRNLDTLEKKYKKNSDGWIIMLSPLIGIVINPIDNTNNLSDEEYLYSCLHSVFKGEEVTYRDEIDSEQFTAWLDSFTKKDKKDIEFFFENLPYTYYKLEYKCRTCQKEYNVDLTSIIDFLE